MIQFVDIKHTSELNETLRKIVLEAVREEFNNTVFQDLLKKHKSVDEGFLSRKQVCELLGLSYPTIHKLTSEKKIKGYKVGNNWRYPKGQFMQYFKKQIQ